MNTKSQDVFISPYFTLYLRNINSMSPVSQRKLEKVKGFVIKSWLIGKYGFKMGLKVGGCLGFGVGIFQAFQMKKFWPIPVSVAGSGLVFGTMFAFSSVLKAEPEYDSNVQIKNNQ